MFSPQINQGGSGAIAAAFERAITKNGGVVLRRAHVEEILVENNRAVGVRLRKNNKKKKSIAEDDSDLGENRSSEVCMYK